MPHCAEGNQSQNAMCQSSQDQAQDTVFETRRYIDLCSAAVQETMWQWQYESTPCMGGLMGEQVD